MKLICPHLSSSVLIICPQLSLLSVFICLYLSSSAVNYSENLILSSFVLILLTIKTIYFGCLNYKVIIFYCTSINIKIVGFDLKIL
jgi:hypothetical protein